MNTQNVKERKSYVTQKGFSRIALLCWMSFASLFLAVLLGCGDDDSSNSRHEDVPSKVDTVFVESRETVFVETVDSIYVERIDNLYKNSEDGSVSARCRTTFDSSFVPGKSLFLGNSLLLGYQLFGMSASAADKDYFHIMEKYFQDHEIPFSPVRVTGIFENMTSLEDQAAFLEERLNHRIDDSTGMVIIQLGDNIDNESEFTIMEKGLSVLMSSVCSRAPNARVLWVGEWYSSALKQFLLKRLTADYGITFVDISDLNTLQNQSFMGQVITYPEELAFSMAYDSYQVEDSLLTVKYTRDDSTYTSTLKINSYQDDSVSKKITWKGLESVVDDGFVASHPNDDAFAEIAKRIMAALGYTL